MQKGKGKGKDKGEGKGKDRLLKKKGKARNFST